MNNLLIIANAFSINMLPKNQKHIKINFEKITLSNVKKLIKNSEKIISAVGHHSTAQIYSNKLGIEIKQNRINYKLKKNHILIIGTFNLKTRIPESKAYTKNELKKIKIIWYKAGII